MEVCYNANTIAGHPDVHSPVTTLTKENAPAFYEPDVQILTSGGLRIPVHASILVLQILLIVCNFESPISVSEDLIFFPCFLNCENVGFCVAGAGKYHRPAA